MDEQSAHAAVCAQLDKHGVSSTIAPKLVSEMSAVPSLEEAKEVAASIIGTVFFEFERLWDVSEAVAAAFTVAVGERAGKCVAVVVDDALAAAFGTSMSASPVEAVAAELDAARAPAGGLASRHRTGRGKVLTDEIWGGRVGPESTLLTPVLYSASDATRLLVAPSTVGGGSGARGMGAGLGVCRHLLAGGCKRKECPFSHDLASTPCKFWDVSGTSSSSCTNGRTCPFLHAAGGGKLGLVDIRSVGPLPPPLVGGVVPGGGGGVYGALASPDASAATDDDLDWALSLMLRELEEREEERDGVGAEGGGFWSGDGAEEDGPPGLDVEDAASFPSLPGQEGGSGRRSTPRSGGHLVREQSVAFRLALSTLQAAFPSVSSGEMRRVLTECGGKAHAAARCIRASTGLQALSGATFLSRAESLSGTAARDGGVHRDAHESRRLTFIARAISQSLPSISTGGAVSGLYAESRGEAQSLARARNTALDRATRAYLAGDGSAARAWSKQGRELDERMAAAQERAASAIFSARNAALSSSGSGGGTTVPVSVPTAGVHALPVRVIDLHGLHPGEAAVLAGSACASHQAGQPPGPDGVWLCFLTGARHHSSRLGKGAVSVHAAVVEALEGRGHDVFDRVPTPGVCVVRCSCR